MIKANGIHHIAIMAADIKSHIAFFSEVLGCKLSALFDMHGVPGGLHAFMHLDDGCYFSIVQLPQVKDIESTLGITHAGTGAGVSAAGTMQHLAFKVDHEADLLNMRDRIRKFGVNVIGPIDHGMCKSIYFAGPDQLALEVACSDGALDAAQWVDPKVLEKAGISADEAACYMTPDDYKGESGAVAQPAYDASKPHMPYPPEVYQQMLQTPDDIITAAASYADPPVQKS
jgi:catechol 2,3-dioxygenase-like lactoylglutathione lyase family enzyme